ncbi:class I SAM-dependent methyltransferase [uncultured Roseobacter sp.]|uniref:class I SAM-dependent methyltransferase n=1 Tax=uncultured Roseobacter sp. TaxID=114847 RepID=UPI00260789A0|nr:class I SAM-dependent methyltransferase [uncultured Roseobacter sp.]
MSNTAPPPDYTSANLEAWEEAAPIHWRHNQARLLKAFSQPGFSCLDETETRILKNLGIAGKDVAQVCCNNGQELISVKSLGAARCVGFDGAQGFLDQARELAEAAGHRMEFVCCDAYDIPAEYAGAFDLVTITIGVLGWMPDIDAFFAAVARLLKPGGAIFVYEHHPVVVMVKPAQAGKPVEWELSYFRKEPFVETEGLDYYGGETYDAKPATSFCHRLSDILMATVNAGLSLEWFEELPDHISNTWWNVEASDIGLPMSYTLVVRKPD